MSNKPLRERSHPLWQLTLIRLLEFWREPESLFWVFLFPVLLAIVLGIAFRNQPAATPRLAVEAGSAHSEAVADLLRASGKAEVSLLSPEQAARALRTGKIDLVVVAGAAGRPGENVTYRFDPTRPEAREARLAVDALLQQALGRTDVAKTTDEPVREPGGRYIDFLIPGLIGLNLMGSGMWGIGFTVVQARNRKLLKRFVSTPMRRSHYLLGFVLSRLFFLIFEVAAVVLFGWIAFGVQVQGSLAAFSVVSLLGALCFSGLALLVAARPESIEVVSGWMNFIMMPMWLLSGSFFSYERFPEATHLFIRMLPLTAVNDGLRAVMHEGAPLHAIGFELAVLTFWGGVSFLLALRFFRWR